MAKWFGKVGYAVCEDRGDGVYVDTIIEREYYGDVITNRRKLLTNEINPGINIANDISIVSDPFAQEHFYDIIYVEYLGTKWIVNDVTVEFPRLKLSMGGLYNEQDEE